MVEAKESTTLLKQSLKFTNTVHSGLLQVEKNVGNKMRESVPGVNFSLTKPTPIVEPHIGSLSPECLEMIGLDPDNFVTVEKKRLLAKLLSGSELFEGSEPTSQCYCGH